MAGKLNVYDMASMGVNVTSSPLHLRDGEVVRAQNWQTDPTMSDGSIRRRDAMTKLNGSVMAGAVKGLIALPFPDQFVVTRTFYAPIDESLVGQTTASWRTSTNGSSWVTITTATLREAAQTYHSGGSGSISATLQRGITPWVGFNHKIYFPGDDYNSTQDAGADTPPTLYSWDGTTAVKLLTIPKNPHSTNESQGIVAIIPYSATELLLTTHDKDNSDSQIHSRVMLYDTVTGALQQLGPETDILGYIAAIAVIQGRVWVAPGSVNAGYITDILWVRPGDAAWTVDTPMLSVSIGGVGIAEFLGDVYVATNSAVGVAPVIRKRASATGAWSTVLTTDGSGNIRQLGPLVVTADGLTVLSFYSNVNGTAPVQRIVSSTDGSSWGTDLDIVGVIGGSHVVSGVPYLDSDGSIYWPIRKGDDTGFIMKRTSAGVWSTVDTVNGLRGPIVALKTV